LGEGSSRGFDAVLKNSTAIPYPPTPFYGMTTLYLFGCFQDSKLFTSFELRAENSLTADYCVILNEINNRNIYTRDYIYKKNVFNKNSSIKSKDKCLLFI